MFGLKTGVSRSPLDILIGLVRLILVATHLLRPGFRKDAGPLELLPHNVSHFVPKRGQQLCLDVIRDGGVVLKLWKDLCT